MPLTETTEASAQDYSIDQLRTMLHGTGDAEPEEKETPAAAENETGEEESSAEETDAKTGQDSDTDEATEETTEKKQEQPRKEDGKFTESVQNRINKAVKAQREAERRAEEAERRYNDLRGDAAKPADKPKLDSFLNDPKYSKWEDAQEAYTEAVADWKQSQREAEAAERARKESATALKRVWDERLAATKAVHKDFDDVLKGSADIEVSALAHQAILESEFGPKILYELSKDPAEAERIAALSPAGQVKAIARLEDKFAAAPETQKPKVTNAPRPPHTVRPNAPRTVDLSDKSLSMGDFEREARRLLGR